jgi:hypothetical protein
VPTSFSKYIGVHSAVLVDAGVFDAILDRDSKLFLDPHLLKHTDVPELTGGYEKLQNKFLSIKQLLVNSRSEGDVFWKAAVKQMKWPEVEGLCIGYASAGTRGSGIGVALRKRLLTTAKEIIDAGSTDPEMFELLGLFEEGFGADRISDMTANVIRDELRSYTKRILRELEIDPRASGLATTESGLLVNPFNQQEMCLVPRKLLRSLPLSLDWSSADRIAYSNEEIRDRLNGVIGSTWKQATAGLSKKEFKEHVLQYPELFRSLVDAYTKKEAKPYDFADDPTGQLVWYFESQNAVSNHPLTLSLAHHPSIDEVESLVLKICNKFKELIEDNGLCKLLYDQSGHPKPEEAAQLLFYGICEAYCEANSILVARESDSGRGPVDFKFGSNRENSVLVEIKKSTNSALKKGVLKQLPEYQKSEKSKRAIYLVIDVGGSKADVERLNELNIAINGSSIKILKVDGEVKQSASKLR